MARVIQALRLFKLDTLPGTNHCPADVACEGALLLYLADGNRRIAVWGINSLGHLFIRYSYKVNCKGQYLAGTARYSTMTLTEFMGSLASRNGHEPQ